MEHFPATAVVTYFARTLTPSSSALLRLMSTTAAAPSVTWLELPPVVVPLPHSGNAGRILPRACAVVPALVGWIHARRGSRGFGSRSPDSVVLGNDNLLS